MTKISNSLYGGYHDRKKSFKILNYSRVLLAVAAADYNLSLADSRWSCRQVRCSVGFWGRDSGRGRVLLYLSHASADKITPAG